MLAFMSEETFPLPTSMGLDLKKLTIPVLRMLHSIAGMTVIVRQKSLYLTPTLTYNGLANFAARSPHPARYDACGSGGGKSGVNNSSNVKIPSFSVPKFEGDTLGVINSLKGLPRNSAVMVKVHFWTLSSTVRLILRGLVLSPVGFASP